MFNFTFSEDVLEVMLSSDFVKSDNDSLLNPVCKSKSFSLLTTSTSSDFLSSKRLTEIVLELSNLVVETLDVNCLIGLAPWDFNSACSVRPSTLAAIAEDKEPLLSLFAAAGELSDPRVDIFFSFVCPSEVPMGPDLACSSWKSFFLAATRLVEAVDFRPPVVARLGLWKEIFWVLQNK
jgi:hypothetical protein